MCFQPVPVVVQVHEKGAIYESDCMKPNTGFNKCASLKFDWQNVLGRDSWSPGVHPLATTKAARAQRLKLSR